MPSHSIRKANGKIAHPFRVARSRTGLGVFATEPIRKNKYIVEYTGPLLTNKQCDERPNNRYWFEVNSRWTIDGSPRSNTARYINHSCRPNADPMIRDRRILIKAISASGAAPPKTPECTGNFNVRTRTVQETSPRSAVVSAGSVA